MANDPTDDELLRRARELQDKADRLQRDAGSRSGSGLAEAISSHAWFRKTTAAYKSIVTILGPIGSVLSWIVGALAAWFRWAALRRPDGVFSWKRLGLTTAISVAGLIGLHMALSAAYYYGTLFEETVYVTGKQEIETGELYQFGGCTSLPCSTETDNGKFYLIESSLYFPRMYYPEENVFANIPQQDAACRVHGYGVYFRTLRWLYKSAQLYQHVTNVSCRPYTEEDIRRAVSEGRIVDDN